MTRQAKYLIAFLGLLILAAAAFAVPSFSQEGRAETRAASRGEKETGGDEVIQKLEEIQQSIQQLKQDLKQDIEDVKKELAIIKVRTTT
jgi:hypothetical protein